MAIEVSDSPIIRFGVFQVNLRSGESLKHGARIRLQGQPLEILRMLLNRPGEVVTREELRQQLWSADTFVDFDHSLNTAVKKLRQVLGDSVERPLYVETMARSGYRFIAPIERVSANRAGQNGAAAASPATAEGGRLPLAESKTHWRARAAGAVMAAVLAIAGYALLAPEPEPHLLRMQQITTSERADPWPGIVTDGARVYFSEREGDHWNTMQTSTAGGEMRPLEAPFRNTPIFDLSPDNSEFLIGELTSLRVDVPLWIWPVQGGSPIRVGEIVADNAVWCPDGKRITYARHGEIHVVGRDGSGDQVLVRTNGSPGDLRWSPDGSRFSYTVGDAQTERQTLWVANADGTDAHVRFPDWQQPANECCALWSRDGKYFLFGSWRDGLLNLWAVRERASLLHWRHATPVQLTSSLTSVWGVVPFRNSGRYLAFGGGGGHERFRYDVASRQFVPFLPGASGVGLTFSKDGNWLVFRESPSGTLWKSKADGRDRVQLVGAPYKASQPRWSPDDTNIVFEAAKLGAQQKAYIINAEGGPIRDILPKDGPQGVPIWSPDGKTIALSVGGYGENGSKAAPGIYLINWQTKDAEKLPGSEQFTSPMWSPDGKYMIAKTYDQHKILRYNPSNTSWTEIANGTVLSGLTWSRDSTFLYFQDLLETGQPVYRMRVGDLRRERFLSFESLFRNGVQRCVFETLAPDGSPIILITRGVGIYTLDLDLPE